ncbi:mitochondrial NADH dehydrogenase [Atractiella rhizophila]|nr:mitochondrial NADH dehydrogenase [Atractiella rhizophila]
MLPRSTFVRARTVTFPLRAHPHSNFQRLQRRQLSVSAKGAAKWAAIGVAGFVGSIGIVVGGLLIWDASTYQKAHIDRIPVSPLALQMERGGPKNLPIAQVYADDEVDDEMKELSKKPRLVVLGGGWGAVATLNGLDTNKYHVTVIAPEKYNLFTPLLPSATVGTVEPRSLVEPLRRIIARLRGHYLQARCVDIDMANRLIEVETMTGSAVRGETPGQYERFYVPYDKCVVAVGAISNTHGIPGVEHCFQLKTIKDAQEIRRRILNNLEMAVMPNTTTEERKKLLSFVICGGGPTGVEFAAELCDFMNEDVMRFLPKTIRNDVEITVIQSRDHLLNTYAQTISDYAEKRFDREHINTILNSRVKEITQGSVTYSTRASDGTWTDSTLPTGFVLWSTGIGMNPVTRRIADKLPNQAHLHALEVDSHLRVKGAPLGSLYAIGDCATLETNLVSYLLDLVKQCDVNNDGHIDFEEFEKMMVIVKRKFPTSTIHVEKIKDVFDQYDQDKNGSLDMDEMTHLFQAVSADMTSLPATAQVANQQGKWLGKKLSKLAKSSNKELAKEVDDVDDIVSDPFVYKHLGSLAYLGNSAVFDFGGKGFAGGIIAMYLWRSIYWSEQVSLRTRAMLMVDWTLSSHKP